MTMPGSSPKRKRCPSCKMWWPVGASDPLPIRPLLGSMTIWRWIRSRLYLLDNEKSRMLLLGGEGRREREGPGSRTPG